MTAAIGHDPLGDQVTALLRKSQGFFRTRPTEARTASVVEGQCLLSLARYFKTTYFGSYTEKNLSIFFTFSVSTTCAQIIINQRCSMQLFTTILQKAKTDFSAPIFNRYIFM